MYAGAAVWPTGVRSMVLLTDNKRRHRRFAVPACTWLQFRNERAACATVSIDLSEEGARYCAIGPVEPGRPVLAHVQLRPGGLYLECKAAVCWSEKMDDGLHHFGLRFLDLSELEREQLAEFLAHGHSRPILAAS